jgi:hypothetical protein
VAEEAQAGQADAGQAEAEPAEAERAETGQAETGADAPSPPTDTADATGAAEAADVAPGDDR